MKTVYTVISDNGDGSNSTHWIDPEPGVDKRAIDRALKDIECFMSGDGVQIREYSVDDEFFLRNKFCFPSTLAELVEENS